MLLQVLAEFDLNGGGWNLLQLMVFLIHSQLATATAFVVGDSTDGSSFFTTACVTVDHLTL